MLAIVAAAPAERRLARRPQGAAHRHRRRRTAPPTTSPGCEPFRAYLQDRLGLPVEIVATADYDALIDAQVSARVQYAIHSASSYVTAQALCACVEPVALPAAFDGSRGFHSVLVAHAGSAIAGARRCPRQAPRLDRRRFGRRPPGAARRRSPARASTRRTISPRCVTAANPEQAVTMLFTDEADLAAGWSSLAGDAATGYSSASSPAWSRPGRWRWTASASSGSRR